METMLAIVCRTYEGINALEKYDPEGTVNCYGGLHGIGSSTGRKIIGRFVVICLEDLRQVIYIHTYINKVDSCREIYAGTLFSTKFVRPCEWSFCLSLSSYK